MIPPNNDFISDLKTFPRQTLESCQCETFITFLIQIAILRIIVTLGFAAESSPENVGSC